MIKNIRYLTGLFFGLVLFSTSCQVQPNEDCLYGFKSGTIVYTGATEVDGCGWLVRIDSVLYHPVNLPETFRFPDLPVLIKYQEDPEVYRCGRGGQAIPSIRITDIRKDTDEVGIMKEEDWDRYYMDPFRMDSAYIDQDWLHIRVSYSGGCREHDFRLWKLPPNALDPPPVELALSHDANGDMCEAYLTRWLVFSLVPIRQAGKGEVIFYLRGSPEMSAYFGKFVYRY